MAKKGGLFYIIDMESSLSSSLSRRVTDMEQYQVFRRWDMQVDPVKEMEAYKDVLKGIVISGSGRNINSSKGAPQVPAEIFHANVPILAICYGLQYIAHLQGVPIVRCWHEQDPAKRTKKTAKEDIGEQGPTMFYRTAEDSPLFHGLGNAFPVWMRHNWMAERVPDKWKKTGFTDRCPVGSFELGSIFALQFHPEMFNSLYGKIILNNFFTRVCGVETPFF